MSVKKSSRGAISKTSSTTTPPASSTANSNQKSSLLKSTFSPSRLQLSLFASVIQGFESQHLRIHDTNTGRLRCEHAAIAGTRITSLDWGYYGTTYRDQQQSTQKKRKRDSTHAGSAVVAFGTSQSEVCMFSPSEGKVVGKLSGPHERGIKDFKFYGDDYLAGWSFGGEGKLVQWDLRVEKAIRFISLPDMAINILAPSSRPSTAGSSISTGTSDPEVICASATPYSVTLTSPTDHQTDNFDAFKTAVHSIIRSGCEGAVSSGFFLAADSDRYINMYDIAQKRLCRTLVVNGRVEALSSSAPGSQADSASSQLLAVTTEAGIVELFSDPFQQPPKQAELGGTIKSKRKGLTRKASALIKLIRPDSKGVVVPVFQAVVHGPDVILASTDGGVDVSFQKVRWQDEGTGELLFDGTREVFRSKGVSSLDTARMNGVKNVGNVHVDESRVVIVDADAHGKSQGPVIEISSEEDDDIEDIDEKSTADVEEESTDEDSSPEDAEMADIDETLNQGQDLIEDEAKSEEDEQATEATFGELLTEKSSKVISIADALVPVNSTGLVTTQPEKGLPIPSGVSLSTVLTQSLRTNDQNLLESCFHTTDLNTIRLTIQRLDSSLAGVLIQKLAERLSSRPGRYGHLLVWVQWTCIVHGGAIAGHPEIAPKIKLLYKVLNERSRSLDNLLLLKGKLDMLDAQLTLRRQLQAERGPARDPEDEEDVIYIEGQEDFSSDEDETAKTPVAATKSRTARKALQDLVEDAAESEDDEAMPLTNGVLHSEEEENDADLDDEASELENGGLVEDEAIESNDDSHPSDREDESDEEEDSDEADSEMDSFINDGSIEVGSDSDVDVDDTPEKPPGKKAKRV